jgi:two-component system, LytTR family, sensor kinase
VSTWFAWLRRRHLGTEADRATFRTLHTAALATPALRGGLTEASAQRSIRHLRSLLASPAVALTDTDALLAWDGGQHHHADQCADLARPVVADGATAVLGQSGIPCDDLSCPLRFVIVAPLTVEERVIGTFQVFAPSASAGLVRAAEEVADWVSGQLELAELDASRTRLMEAEVRALRAQISPHFVYNALNTIAALMRTDPGRARELLLGFADLNRVADRPEGTPGTLGDELTAVRAYLQLEQARFGPRLQVEMVVDEGVHALPMAPRRVLDAVRAMVQQRIEPRRGGGTVTVTVERAGAGCVVRVGERDGDGRDSEPTVVPTG